MESILSNVNEANFLANGVSKRVYLYTKEKKKYALIDSFENKELQIHTFLLPYPYILNIYSFTKKSDYFSVVVAEYCPFTILKATQEYRPFLLEDIEILCNCLVYIHSKKVVHLDIKEENILINESGVIKVADFGLSDFFESSYEEDYKELFGMYNDIYPDSSNEYLNRISLHRIFQFSRRIFDDTRALADVIINCLYKEKQFHPGRNYEGRYSYDLAEYKKYINESTTTENVKVILLKMIDTDYKTALPIEQILKTYNF